MEWLLVLSGVVGAIAFSILLALILRHQELHLQVELLKRAIRRARAPWAEENAMWEKLNGAVQQIPKDLVEKATAEKRSGEER